MFKSGPFFQNTRGLLKYFVRFHPNGGSGSMPDQLFKGSKIQALTKNIFARTGYLFQGWHRTASSAAAEFSDQQQVGKLSRKNKAIVTLYAIWKAITYTIRYNGNGATSGSMADTGHTYDTAAALRANAFVRTGHLFQGWATSAGGGVSYANGASVKNLSAVQNAIINLYAVWKAITYTVVYNGNGATGGSTASSSHTYGVSRQLVHNGFSRIGYNFSGWATSAGGGVVYSNAQWVINLVTTQGAVFNLYAVWARITGTYKLRYDYGWGWGMPAGQQDNLINPGNPERWTCKENTGNVATHLSDSSNGVYLKMLQGMIANVYWGWGGGQTDGTEAWNGDRVLQIKRTGASAWTEVKRANFGQGMGSGHHYKESTETTAMDLNAGDLLRVVCRHTWSYAGRSLKVNNVFLEVSPR